MNVANERRLRYLYLNKNISQNPKVLHLGIYPIKYVDELILKKLKNLANPNPSKKIS